MPGREQRRQKKLAKKRTKEIAKKKELARHKNTMQSFAGQLKAACDGPVDRCLVSEDLIDGDRKFGSVLISRRMPDGRVGCARFLVDGMCLGVKDADGIFVFPTQLTEFIGRIEEAEEMRSVAPSAARKLVEGAIAFARQFDMEPHPAYRKLELIWSDIDVRECLTEYQFGDRAGKPVYVSGPGDTPTSAMSIIAKLDQTAGEGNYESDYDVAFGLEENDAGAEWYDDPELDVDIDEDVINVQATKKPQ